MKEENFVVLSATGHENQGGWTRRAQDAPSLLPRASCGSGGWSGFVPQCCGDWAAQPSTDTITKAAKGRSDLPAFIGATGVWSETSSGYEPNRQVQNSRRCTVVRARCCW